MMAHPIDTELKYLLDGHPVSAQYLIDLACSLSDDFANDWMKQTSIAAAILRHNNYTVARNPNWSD